jgi:hypothetical protein
MRGKGSGEAGGQHGVQHIIAATKWWKSAAVACRAISAKRRYPTSSCAAIASLANTLSGPTTGGNFAEKVEIDSPPLRIGLEEANHRLEQQQEIKSIFGCPRR